MRRVLNIDLDWIYQKDTLSVGNSYNSNNDDFEEMIGEKMRRLLGV
jgi:hypothetical protein